MLRHVKRRLERLPVIGPVVRRSVRWFRIKAGLDQSPQQIFDQIYRTNSWNGDVSRSGTGSDLVQTRNVVAALPAVFAAHGVKTMLDVPCGDFYWMRTVDLSEVTYLGGDIVPALVDDNQRYATDRISFRHVDLLTSPLPTVDLVFCRDCLIHLSDDDATRALRNICASGSRLLLTTTYCDRAENPPIPTGSWRPLNLERPPFSLPKPILLINEGCTEKDGGHADKSLGLWEVETLRRRLFGR
jgi:hypothetical protein